MTPVQQLGEESWSVVCAACCHIALVLSLKKKLKYFFNNLVLINRRNGPRYQHVLALCAFFNRGGTEGTISSKTLCSMFVYVLFYVNLRTGLILSLIHI